MFYIQILVTEIYPNPTKCNVDIDLREQTNFTKVIVTNFSGQEIINKNYFNESAIHLQIEGESGIYFITVKTQNKLVTKKILKI